MCDSLAFLPLLDRIVVHIEQPVGLGANVEAPPEPLSSSPPPLQAAPASVVPSTVSKPTTVSVPVGELRTSPMRID